MGNRLQIKSCLERKSSIVLTSLCFLFLPIKVKLYALVSLQCLQRDVLYIFPVFLVVSMRESFICNVTLPLQQVKSFLILLKTIYHFENKTIIVMA